MSTMHTLAVAAKAKTYQRTSLGTLAATPFGRVSEQLIPGYRGTAVGCRHTSLSFPSAASGSAIGGLSAAQLREVTSTASSAERRNVLDPNGVVGRRGRKAWSGRRGQKAWSEGVAERRGRKTCLPESQDFF